MKIQNAMPWMPRLSAPQMGHGFQPLPGAALDQVDIRFGAKKKTFPNAETEIKNAQVATAKALGVPVQDGNVDLDALRQTFYAKYYAFVAEAMIDLGADDYQNCKDFYNLFGDMNLTQDDFCCGEGLLHYSLPDDMLNDGDYHWPDVLGYQDYKACGADMPRLLKGVAGKLGMTDPNPTDEMVINAMATQSVGELKKFKKALETDAPAKPVSVKAPVVQVAFKKAINTTFKPAVSARDASLKGARVNTAKLLGVPVKNGDVDLETLRQTFYDKYYDFVAKSLIENGEESYLLIGGLYSAFSDMNLTQDDFCCGEGLLNYAFDDTKDTNSANYKWSDVLGYESFKACEADMPRFLKKTAQKVGLKDPNPTDESIIGAMEKMFEAELQTAFGIGQAHPYAGKTFVLTGTLPSLTRSEAEAKIKAVGGKIASSVTHKTDFVLAGEKAGNKLGMAQALKIKVLDETAFLEQLK